ncbi:Imm50 family immunity protein [Rhodococcus sp. NPDC003322]
MSWVDLLLDNRSIRAIFGDVDPSLDSVDLHEVRLDRQGGSLILNLDLADYPAVPPKKWVAQEANTVQIELELSPVHSVTIEGWGTEMGTHIEIARNAEGRIELTCRDVPRIKVTAEWLSLRKIGAYQSVMR